MTLSTKDTEKSTRSARKNTAATTRELLAERRRVADFLIIEAPAAIGASESLALAPLVDGIVVVADARHTDRDEVEQVRIQFEQVGGQVVGAVMSNAVTSR